MNRVILLAATALVGSGCWSSHDRAGTLTVYWQFRSSSGAVAGDFGQTSTGCDVAVVDTIRLTVDGVALDQPCVQSNGVPGTRMTLAPGTHTVVADGYRSGERVFTTSGTADVRDGADTQGDLTLDAVTPQGLVIYYHASGLGSLSSTQCAVNGVAVAGVTYRLEDGSGNVLSTTETAGGQLPVACDPASFGIQIPDLPLGGYVLRYLQLIDANGFALVQTCATAAPHTGFPDDVTLVTATVTCT